MRLSKTRLSYLLFGFLLFGFLTAFSDLEEDPKYIHYAAFRLDTKGCNEDRLKYLDTDYAFFIGHTREYVIQYLGDPNLKYSDEITYFKFGAYCSWPDFVVQNESLFADAAEVGVTFQLKNDTVSDYYNWIQ